MRPHLKKILIEYMYLITRYALLYLMFSDTSSSSSVFVSCLDDAWNITVDLQPLRQKYPDFDPDECYIGFDNANCTGSIHGDSLYFRQNYKDCKTIEKVI